MHILAVVAPIFLIILLGYSARRWGMIKPAGVQVLNDFAYYIGLPALIFLSFWQINWLEPGVLKTVGMNLLVLLFLAVVLMLVLSHIRLKDSWKASLFLVIMVGNSVYMGFPLIGKTFSPQLFSAVIGIAAAHLAFGLVLSTLAAEFFVVRSKSYARYLHDFVQNPFLLAIVFGFLASNLRQAIGDVPVLQSTFSMVAATASPVALFALGAFMHKAYDKKHLGLASWAMFGKLIVLPVLVYFLLCLLKEPRALASIAFITAAMPTAASTFVIAEKFDLETDFVASVIVISTVVSLVTLVAAIALFA